MLHALMAVIIGVSVVGVFATLGVARSLYSAIEKIDTGYLANVGIYWSGRSLKWFPVWFVISYAFSRGRESTTSRIVLLSRVLRISSVAAVLGFVAVAVAALIMQPSSTQ